MNGIITISDLYNELKKMNERLERIEKKENVLDQLTVPEAAKIIKKDFYWIVGKIESGELPALNVGSIRKPSYRIDPIDFHLFCKRLKIKPALNKVGTYVSMTREEAYKIIEEKQKVPRQRDSVQNK